MCQIDTSLIRAMYDNYTYGTVNLLVKLATLHYYKFVVNDLLRFIFWKI